MPAVLWPAVTYLVPEARLGSANALMTFCQQIGWAAMSWGIGAWRHAAPKWPVPGRKSLEVPRASGRLV